MYYSENVTEDPVLCKQVRKKSYKYIVAETILSITRYDALLFRINQNQLIIKLERGV